MSYYEAMLAKLLGIDHPDDLLSDTEDNYVSIPWSLDDDNAYPHSWLYVDTLDPTSPPFVERR